MKHLMIDLETFGRNPGCVIHQIGLVEFTDNEILRSDLLLPSIVEQMEQGLIVEPETLEWWLFQGIPRHETAGRTTLASCFQILKDFFHDADTIWANSPSFDLEIVKHFTQKIVTSFRWEYYKERDVRTLKAMLQLREIPPFQGQKHNALDDALHQVKIVQQFWKKHQIINY